jgi:receptor protein-tyrosine kinase
VTIIDADLRRPRVHRYLNIVGAAGLTNILAGMAELDDVIQPYGDGTLSVLASGPTPPNPSELLASGLMVTLVDQLREKNDFVLIDTPPILPVADASGLAAITDGVVLSVRHGQTRRELVERSVGIIERVDGKTLGVVLNMTPLTADISAGYGYANENGRR